MTLAHSTVSLQSRSSTARTFLRYARSQSVAQGRHSPISHISSTTSISPSSSRRRAHLPLSRFYSLDARTGSSPSPASSPSSASSSQSQSQGADGHSRESSSSSTTSSAGSSGSRRRHGQFRRTMNLMAWLPVAAFITSHVCSIGNVTGGSMSPTFNPVESFSSGARRGSDVVLLNRWAAGTHQYRVGDVVTLLSPTDPNMLLTKRILALGGDTVRVHAPGSGRSIGQDTWTRVRIPPGHAWVEGDASAIAPSIAGATGAKSRDSREFGPVPLGLVTSRVDLILWPPARFGRPGPRPGFSHSRGYSNAHLGASGSSGGGSEPSTASIVHPSLARSLSQKGGSRAHPADSTLSPYTDYDDPRAREAKPNPEADPDAHPSSDADADGDADDAALPLGAALERKGSPSRKSFSLSSSSASDNAVGDGDGDVETNSRRKSWKDQVWRDDDVEKIWRARLNSMSRGGQLGDDAGR